MGLLLLLLFDHSMQVAQQICEMTGIMIPMGGICVRAYKDEFIQFIYLSEDSQ
uniref:Uncharacterized protein n=1 Tax=Arundo donax TaxID=35708 RepID=A0A0A8YMF0_ARUDO